MSRRTDIVVEADRILEVGIAAEEERRIDDCRGIAGQGSPTY